MGDQPVAKAYNCTTHSKHKTEISMPPARFGPVIPAIERRQTYTLDLTEPEIGFIYFLNL
jgi:hypothetical protein